MGFDQGLAERVRSAFAERNDVTEKKMFGGLTFMVAGHMSVGVAGEELMVRVGPQGYEEALAQPHAREMDFTGRALKGFVFVATPGFESDSDLDEWISRGVMFVESLPPK